jgi:hypothetical protein
MGTNPGLVDSAVAVEKVSLVLSEVRDFVSGHPAILFRFPSIVVFLLDEILEAVSANRKKSLSSIATWGLSMVTALLLLFTRQEGKKSVDSSSPSW